MNVSIASYMQQKYYFAHETMKLDCKAMLTFKVMLMDTYMHIDHTYNIFVDKAQWKE